MARTTQASAPEAADAPDVDDATGVPDARTDADVSGADDATDTPDVEGATDTPDARTDADDTGDAPDVEAAGAKPESGAGPSSEESGAGLVRVVAIALVVIAAVAAGYFGWSWYGAAHDESLSFSKERDTVLRAGEQGVQNLNTLDYRKADEGFSLWEDSSTGDLHQQLVQGRDQFVAQVRQARTVTTAKILDGAVVELDARTGKARMVVAVQITVTPATGTPATKQSRMQAQLTRTPSGWKLSALGQAPVGTSG